MVWPAIAIVVAGALLGWVAGGAPTALELPERSDLNISGGGAVTPEFLAVTIGLTIYTASFVAEIVRSGIQAVAWGQTEAAGALGLSRGQALKLVLLPQALRVIIPPLTNQYLNLTKNSSLAVAVGYPDLVSISNTTLNQTGRAVECIAVIMAVYLTLSLVTAGTDELVQRTLGDPRALTDGHRAARARHRPPAARAHAPARWRGCARTSSPTGRARWRPSSSSRCIARLAAGNHRLGRRPRRHAPGQRRLPRARTLRAPAGASSPKNTA